MIEGVEQYTSKMSHEKENKRVCQMKEGIGKKRTKCIRWL